MSIPVNDFITKLGERRLRAYEASPGDVREHFGIEQVVLAGGYGYRQILELVQNGADAILEAHEAGKDQGDSPRIEVLLEDSCLYVANTGMPFTEEGIDALLRSHSSPKRGNQIGRFGLGFKSLLRLGGRIDITSGPMAFGFDPERCRAELRGRFNVQDAPGLRLAWSLEEGRAATLRERFPWATTVVCAQVNADAFIDHLKSEIDGFPSEFLLFLPVPVCLALHSGGGEKAQRELRRESDGLEVILDDGEARSHWRVTKKMVSIADQRARDDATHVHTRDEVPLAWAIPIEGWREEAGRFWAFFPTHTPTYMSGILNAPWKLNSDRNGIIPGEWNTALMKEAASLIVETLPLLKTDSDPGRVIDAFPRQLDRADDDAAPLIESLWAALADAAVVPDCSGNLCLARDLWRHPRETPDLLRAWQALADEEQRARLVHPSCMEKQRASRLKALARRLVPDDKAAPRGPNLRRMTAKDWFMIVASNQLGQANQVLKLSETFEKDCTPDEWSPVRPTLAIIPSASGNLLMANEAVLVPEGTNTPDGRHPVAKWLSDDLEAKRVLTDVIKVKPLDDTLWKDILLEAVGKIRTYPSDANNEDWMKFWSLFRAAPPSARSQFIGSSRGSIRVKRQDGRWVLPQDVLLPGALVNEEDDSINQQILPDPLTHQDDEVLLVALGVCALPDGEEHLVSYEQLNDWLSHWRSHYRHSVNGQASWGYLEPRSLAMPRGWKFLPRLVGSPNEKLTRHFLIRVAQGKFVDPLLFGHSTVSRYQTITVPHAFLWFLLENGEFRIGSSVVRLSAVVSRLHEPEVAKLAEASGLRLPLEKLKGAVPQVTPSADQVRMMWLALMKLLVTPEALADDSLRELWTAAAKDKVLPTEIPTATGFLSLTEVFVTGSPDLALRARLQGHVVVTLDSSSLLLWLSVGARNLAELMKPGWTESIGPADRLVIALPELSSVLRAGIREMARCQPVVGLKLFVADDATPVPCLMWQNTLYLEAERLSTMSRADRLKVVLAETAAAGWLEHSANVAFRILVDSEVDGRRAFVGQGASLAERLLRAVGRRPDPLRQSLGTVGGLPFLQNVEPLKLAELVLTHLGPATLSVLREVLDHEGLKPPSRWNSPEARAFIASMGFPAEFAASPESRRDAEELISGPIDLPPLHDFQDEVFEGIRDLISGGASRRRAVVSLPTGGGKTRVTVQAAVMLVLKPSGCRRSVIWVAQTDELCEQAVQAFRQVWLNLGAQRTDLRIVRLWGGNPNPSVQELDKPLVIVASIQTLNSRMSADGLDWLRNPGLVVVDECHHAITPSYTNLLRFLDAESSRPGAPQKDEPLILGLSATPFRTDDDESRRLARRFDNRWLPASQEHLHRRLREQGVLATVINEALDSGVGLTPDEIARLSQLREPWEGIDFENVLEAINQRLAGSAQRNERLLARIQHAEERSILLFANSVLHAQEMAVRLNLASIPAASISGDTPSTTRRHFLAQFQRGELRVLCNHSVLSTGFDAPKVDMVLISRAVFSPVRYMQMVGRGLRGEKNGGKARCRMVTVMDNLGRFQDRHPYHYCQRFFV